MSLRLFVCSALVTTAALAHAASFDCKLAHTPREHAVCDNQQLSALDSRLSLAYTNLRAQLSPIASAAVQFDQRDWLHWLDAVCPLHGRATRSNINDCLTHEYDDRINTLTLGPRLPDSHVLYPRAHYVIVPSSKTDPHVSSELADQIDPGFGVGTFAWPQIDTPTPQETTWNHAIYAYALALTGSDTHHPTSFNTAVDASGTMDIFYSVRSANAHLIVADVTISTFGYGAAHPLTGVNTFTWWLDRSRQFQPTDIFLDATHWQASLIAPVIAKLNANPDLKPYLWKDDELRKGVAAGITDPTTWTLSPSGLTLRFGQYAVAPYVAGMPTVTLTWPELKPYLNPTFDPTILPPLLKQKD